MSSFRELRVWQRAIALAEIVYRVTEDFPRREHYGLASQMRRSAVSIPSNVAEGQGRLTTVDWLRFLGLARGSLFELETQIMLAQRLNFVASDSVDELTKQVSEVARALAGFINHLETKQGRRRVHRPTD